MSHPNLEQAVQSYIILLDTCFAMNEAFELFLNNYRNVLQKNPIKVPTVVIGELTWRMKRPHPTNPDAQEQAKRGLQLIEKARREGLLEFCGDSVSEKIPKNKGAADMELVRVVTTILPRKPILVLTFDKNLTQQLRTSKEHPNYAVKDLLIAKILRNGKIVERKLENEFTGNPTLNRSHQNTFRPSSLSIPSLGNIKPFAISTKLEPNLDAPLTVRESLGEGSRLSLKNGSSITLRKALASGGEGTVYEVDDPNLVCKVYHNTALTEGKRRKIELMQTRQIRNPSICWVCDAIYDSTGTFRGFTMPKVPKEAKPLGSTLFLPSVFTKMNPQWTRIHSTKLAIKILKNIEYLHQLNIIIGDINPQNILFKGENNVYFVDCDSFQVEGFPCPVGTVNFTAPEIQGKNFKEFLRTKEHELFSVATLLFMIFLPGKTPYSHEGGADGATNIKDGHFPYALGDRYSDRAPKGHWKYAWSHLMRQVKDGFNQSFHKDEWNKGRITLGDWIKRLQWYQKQLEQFGYHGHQQQVGFELSILPENRRRVEKDGVIEPPIRPNGKTDLQVEMEYIIVDMQKIPRSNFAPYRQKPQPVPVTSRKNSQPFPTPPKPVPLPPPSTPKTKQKTLMDHISDFFRSFFD